MSDQKLISFGCGVNSVAMTIYLLKRGEYYPVIFADTGVEHPATYKYLEYFRQYLREKWNHDIIIISPKSYPGLYSKRVRSKAHSILYYCIYHDVIPMVCQRWCTLEYKRDPVRRFGKLVNIYTHLIAFSIDEEHRAKSDFQKYKQEYPLIVAGIDREGCKNIIHSEGLEIPKKSGCFFCPYQKPVEWKALWKFHPRLFNISRRLEERISRKLKRKVTMRTDYFSLAEMEEIWDQENPLFPDLCDYGDQSCYMCGL